jgi:hypothetical protein
MQHEQENPSAANAILFGSPFDPEAPDYERYRWRGRPIWSR